MTTTVRRKTARRKTGKPPRATPDARTRPHQVLTHPDRLYWPEDGLSKHDLLDYYEEVWPLIAPHLVARPLALKRYPEGIAHEGFFQKKLWRGMPKAILVSEDERSADLMLSITDFDGLAGLVQSGVLEIHVWGSTLARLEAPDRIVFDLDPAEDVGWEEVRAAADIVRAKLTEVGLSA